MHRMMRYQYWSIIRFVEGDAKQLFVVLEKFGEQRTPLKAALFTSVSTVHTRHTTTDDRAS